MPTPDDLDPETPDDLAARGAYEPDLDEWAGLLDRFDRRRHVVGAPISVSLACPLPALFHSDCPACLGDGGDGGDGPCPTCKGIGFRTVVEVCGAGLELHRETRHGILDDGLDDAPEFSSIACEAGHVLVIPGDMGDGERPTLTPALAAEALVRLVGLVPR